MNQKQSKKPEARLTLRLPKWLKKKIHHEAIDAGVSMSEIICAYLETNFSQEDAIEE